MYQTCHSGASIDRVLCTKCAWLLGQSLGGRPPLTHSHAPKQCGNIRATCRGTVGKAAANPSDHKRMTRKSMLHMFDQPGFLTKASNHLGLRGYVLDTKFGPRFDVTQPLVLTRIRQDGNDFTSTTTHLVLFQMSSSSVLPSQTCFIVLTCLGFWNTRVDRGCSACRKSRLLRRSLARLGPWQIFFVFLGLLAESERCCWLGMWTAEISHRIARKCAGTGGCCSVSGEKHVHPKASASSFKILHVTTPASF